MPTLNAMFRLMDGYSSQVKKIVENTDRAAKVILGASKNTDGFNDSLMRTGAAANMADSGLSKLVKTAVSLAAVKKGMDLTDTYTNTNARLAMITGSLEEQRALQKDIFAAADRSRGDYTEMANATAKLKMLAGDTFGSNLEAVGFTELLTKSLKVSGAGTAEQNSAFLQLTQAMTSGRLQGDEFVAVMENAPMVADAIAQYMGKTKAELKELSSDGAITADIIKGAMFQAADEINGKFSQMTPTFADAWTKIKNAGTEAFSGVFEKVNAMLNSDMGQEVVENLTGMVFMAAGAFSALLDAIGWVGDRIEVVEPFIWGLVAAWAAYNIILGISNGLVIMATFAQSAHAASMAMESGATFLATMQQYGFNAALAACPITWIITGIVILVASLFALASYIATTTGVASSGFGVIAGSINVVIQFFRNLLLAAGNVALGIWEAWGALGTNMGIAMGNAVAGSKAFLYSLLSTAASVISKIAAELNKLPFVDFDYSGITAAADEYAAKSAAAAEKKQEYVSVSDSFTKGLNTFDAFGDGWAKNAFESGASWGDGVSDKISGLLSGFNPDSTGGTGFDFSQFATSGNPATVKGTGKGGSVKVEADQEDIQWMRKLAERDYVARIAQNTLAPNIKVEFNGPITKEADTDGVVNHMINQLKEVIATAPEGVPG